MSYCQRCGSRFETGKFRCPNCGAPLTYGPSVEGPSLLTKLRGYKSPLILVALAVIIVLTRAAVVLTAIYWIFIIGLIVAGLVLWLRGRNRKRINYGSQQNRYGSSNSGAFRGNRNNNAEQRKPAKVIPFRRKVDPKSKAKED